MRCITGCMLCFSNQNFRHFFLFFFLFLPPSLLLLIMFSTWCFFSRIGCESAETWGMWLFGHLFPILNMVNLAQGNECNVRFGQCGWLLLLDKKWEHQLANIKCNNNKNALRPNWIGTDRWINDCSAQASQMEMWTWNMRLLDIYTVQCTHTVGPGQSDNTLYMPKARI